MSTSFGAKPRKNCADNCGAHTYGRTKDTSGTTKSTSLPTEAAYTVAVRKAATVEVTTKMRQRDWGGTAAAAPALAVPSSAGSLF